MTFTYNLATDIGKVRLWTRDFSAVVEEQLFQDEELQVFLDGQGSNVLLAAADALTAVASSAALLHKMERIGDYQYDSKGMAEALLKAAANLRERAATGGGVAEPTFDYAEETLSEFNEVEILWNEVLRGS